MSPVPDQVYEFGRFRLNVAQRELLRDGTSLAVMPKVFDLLVLLVRSPGRLLTKEEILERVWPDACVDEGSLARTVSRLRSLLGEGGRTGGFVETLSKQGYRFVADVRSFAPSVARDRTLAVLPFRNLGPADPESEALGLGIADALITRLSRLRTLRVRPTSSVLRFGAESDALETGRQLRVEAVLEGRLQVHAGRARVTVQLLRVSEEQPIWGEAFEEEAGDLYRLQEAVAGRVAAVLAVEMSREEEAALGRPGTTSPVAYPLYLKARSFTYRYDPDALRKAIDLYELAIEADPSFAAAHAGLAAAYTIGAGTFLPAEEANRQAHRAVEEALRRDDSLAEAHVTLGMLRFWSDRDPAGAEAAMRRALHLAPNDSLAHHSFAWQLAARGRFAEASSEIERAAELDPTSVAIAVDLGLPLYLGRQPERALEQFRRGVAMDPGFWYAHHYEGLALLSLGRFEEAHAAFSHARDVSHGAILESRVAIGVALARAGDIAAAEAVRDEVATLPAGRLSPFEQATLSAALGDLDDAFHLLGRAVAERDKWLMWVEVDPRLDPLRGDPRFDSIRAAAGLR